ncbi:MAG: DUF58 domain-containing protein [Thermoplasmata archaeon]
MISHRGWALMASGFGSLLLGFFTVNLLIILVGWAVLVFAAAEIGIFSWSTRRLRHTRFDRSREGPAPRVAVNGTTGTEVTLTNTTGAGFWAEIFDTTPASCEILLGSPRSLSWWPPGESLELTYLLRPSLRGTFAVGPTVVVAQDPAGLAFDTLALDTIEEFTVVAPVPTNTGGQVGQKLRTRWMGASTLRHRGYGTEFRSIRPYLPYDDIRSVAWKRSGQGKLFIREYEQESRQDFVLVVDVSRAMNAGLVGQTALDRAVEAALVLVAFVGRREDRIGVLAYDEGPVVFLPPGQGAAHRFQLTNALSSLGPTTRSFDLSGAMDGLRRDLATRAHLLMFSALVTNFSTFHARVAALYSRGHRLLAFVPQLPAFYPVPTDPVQSSLLQLPEATEVQRTRAAMTYLRTEGIPTFPYDRRGAVARLLTAYARIRTWGAG